MKKYLKWILIIAGLFFVFAIYKSENKRLKELRESAKRNAHQASTTLITKQTTKNTNRSEKKAILKLEKRIYVDKFSGDTLDLSKDKFIMISANRFSDKNITYGISIWYDMNTCAWSPGILKISVCNKDEKPLKTSTVKIEKELMGTCQQFEEINLYMGDLIYQAYYINAEFTDDRGEKYYQSRKNLGEIIGTEITAKANRTEDEEKALKKIKQEVQILFDALMVFKDKSDFHFYGFGVGYKYNKWLREVKSLQGTPEDKILWLNQGFGVNDLLILGLEYSGSRGQGTETTKWARKKISDGLNKD